MITDGLIQAVSKPEVLEGDCERAIRIPGRAQPQRALADLDGHRVLGSAREEQRMDKALSPEAVAEPLAVVPETVRTGGLPGVKPGRVWRVRDSDLQAMMDGVQALARENREGARCAGF